MTIIHAHLIGDKAMIPRDEFEKLLELARQSEEIKLQISNDDIPTFAIMKQAEQSGSFDFWRQEGEDLYSAEDGEPV